MKYFDFIYRLFVKKKKPKVDEFDEQFGFMLKYGIVNPDSYYSLKQYYFQHHRKC